MKTERTRPPALATWLVRHMCHGDTREALIGDLFERFNEGESARWFWRQVLAAITPGALSSLRANWPLLCFSASGTALLLLLSGKTMRIPAIERLWVLGIGLPWPISSAYDFGFRGIVSALIVQPLLAVTLLIEDAFSWSRIFRTFAISFGLLVATSLSGLLFAFPRLTPVGVCCGAVMFFVALLISAWAGCRTGTLRARMPDGGQDCSQRRIV